MTDSIWRRTISPQEQGVLERSDDVPMTADFLIVGGGLVGLAVAYYLSQARAGSVVVVDREGPAAEASSANAGGLWFAHESSRQGVLLEFAKLSDALYAELGEEMDFGHRRDGILDLLWSEKEIEEATARCEGLRAVGFAADMVERERLREFEPGLSDIAAGGLLTPNDGQLHPVRLAAALTERLRQNGALVCGGVEAFGLGRTVETSRGPISAGTVVVASGAWTPLVTRALGWEPPIRPIRGTLLALPSMPAGTVRHTVMAKEYYHLQLPEGPVVGGGTHEDVGFIRGVDDSSQAAIRAEMNQLFPALADQATQLAWSGFRPFCEDELPVVGEAPQTPDGAKIYIAAGHFRKGVMLAPSTGKLLADVILHGDASVDISALSPLRFDGAAAAPA